MKQKNFLKIALTLLFLMVVKNSFGQTELYNQGFETDLSGYTQTPNQTPSTDPGDQYFSRAEPSNTDIYEGSVGPYTNVTGSWLFVGSNPNTINSGNPGVLSTGLINVTGYENFELSIDFGAVPNDWDSADELKVEYSWNNTDWSTLYNFVSSGTNSPLDLANNSTGGNNTANGVTLTYALQTITSTNFTGSGGSLYIRVVCNSAANYEAFGLDNIVLTGTLATSDPIIGFDNATSSETETDTSFEVLIPVTVSNYGSYQIDVSVAVTGGTAEVADYILNTTSLSFTADGSQNISLDINPDTDDFEDETIILTLTETSAVTGLIISQSTHTITVTEDETPPSIGFDAATSSETETDATFTSANIPITVSNYSGTQIDINVSVTGGTAEVGDYTFTSPTALSFTADETKNITVDINDDADTDGETIIFTITETSSVTGLIISESTHTLTITDDEIPPLPTSGTVFITEILDSDVGFNNDYLELFNNSSEEVSLINSKLLRFSDTNNFEYAYDFGVDESTTSADITIPAYGFLIITRGSTRADFNTANSITLDSGVNFNGGNTNLFFGTGRRWKLATGGIVDTNDGTLIDDTNAGVGNNKDYKNIFTGTYITGTTSEGTPGALEYLIYNGGAWVNSVAMDGTTGSKDAYIYDALTLSANTEINDLGIASGGSLTINSGNSLIVNGTSSGNVTYNTTLGTENWYLMSSPVVGETFDNAYVAANELAISGTNNGIATYTTNTDTWSYMQTGGGSSFTPGTGYSVRRETGAGSGSISFTGSINTDPVTPAVVIGGKAGYNLIGNPYTSYLNSATFLTDNTADLVSETIWVWNQATGMYETKVTGTGFVIAPTQGFIVSAKNATNLNIAKSYQTSSGNAFQKSAKTELKILMTDGTNNRFAKIYYLDNATKGFDNGYDGETFTGIENSLDVYTKLLSEDNGKNYQIQSLPSSDFENMVISVGVKAASGKEVTFAAEALNLPEGINVFLEDRITNTFTQLNKIDGKYTTIVDSNITESRFYIHTTTSSVLNTDEEILNTISIYNTNNSNLRITGLKKGKTTLKLYNLLGKQILNSTFNKEGLKDLSLPKFATGIYIVQLETEAGKLNKKITLK